MRWGSLGSAQRGVTLITSSAVVAQAITLLVTPVLTRLYAPEAFGAFAVLQSAVMILATFASLRLESAIPIAQPAEVRALLAMSTMSAIAAGILLVPAGDMIDALRLPDAGPAAWLLPSVLVILTVAFAVLSNVALRDRDYGSVASRNLLQQFGTAGGQLLFALRIPTAVGLTLGLVVGRSLGIVSLYRQARRGSLNDVRSASLSATLRRYWRYPAIFMPSALLNVLGSQLPLLVVAAQFGPDSAGNLAQAIRIGGVPAALVGAAVSSVVMSEIANRVRGGERNNRRRYLKVTAALLPLGLAWGAFLLFVAPSALPWILGPGWDAAGTFSAALALSVAAGLVASPLSVVFFVYERALLNISIDTFRILILSGIAAACWRAQASAQATVLAMSVGLTLVYVVTWLSGLRVVSMDEEVPSTDG